MATTEDTSDYILTLPNNIVVRRYRLSDAPSKAKHANNDNVRAMLRNGFPNPYTEDSARGWMDHTNSPESMRASGPWTAEKGSQGPLLPTHYAVVVDGEPCGSIGLEFGAPKDVYFRSATLGYWLGEEYWGKGVMGAVVPAFAAWAWRTFGVLVRINGDAYGSNVASYKCLLKAGLEVEGRRKWAACKNGVLQDEILLGMVRPDAVGESEAGS